MTTHLLQMGEVERERERLRIRCKEMDKLIEKRKSNIKSQQNRNEVHNKRKRCGGHFYYTRLVDSG